MSRPDIGKGFLYAEALLRTIKEERRATEALDQINGPTGDSAGYGDVIAGFVEVNKNPVFESNGDMEEGRAEVWRTTSNILFRAFGRDWERVITAWEKAAAKRKAFKKTHPG